MYKILFVLIILNTLISCKKIEFKKLETKQILLTTDDAYSLKMNTYNRLKGIVYDESIEFDDFYSYSLYLTDISSDDALCTSTEGMFIQFARHTIDQENQILSDLWYQAYKIIDNLNILITDVPKIDDFPLILKNDFMGEVYTLRAYMHFILLNLFDNIPYVSEPDHVTSYKVQRPKEFIYEYIIEDLLMARSLQSASLTVGNELINKNVTTAIFARVYLYQGNWDEAFRQAETLMETEVFSLSSSYGEIFYESDDNELIWKLGYNTDENNLLFDLANLPEEMGEFAYSATPGIFGSFESVDIRRAISIIPLPDDTFKIDKFKSQTIDIPIIRFAEILLIAAEASLRLDNEIAALEYINQLRFRAGLTGYSSLTLDDILNERRRELAFEGHRWFDLKRTEKLVEIMDIDAYKLNWPIPQSVIDENTNFIQNPGYYSVIIEF